jgi:hypothetical protein
VSNLDERTIDLSAKIEELTFWVKFSVWTTFTKMVTASLREDIDRLVYELSTGDKSTRDIAQIVSSNGMQITHQTVKNMWQRWAAVPIVIPAGTQGRFKRVVSLKSIGIQVPAIKGLPKEGDTIDE